MFSKCRANSDYQVCVCCGKHIGKGNLALSLRKICHNNINIWLHSGCIEDFCKLIIKFKEDNIKELLVRSL